MFVILFVIPFVSLLFLVVLVVLVVVFGSVALPAIFWGAVAI